MKPSFCCTETWTLPRSCIEASQPSHFAHSIPHTKERQAGLTVWTPAQPRRTPLEGFLPLLQSRAPGELHAFAALAHMLTDKLPPHYARQLVTAGTDAVVALVAALGMPVSARRKSSSL